MRVSGELAPRFTLGLNDLLSELRRRQWTLIRWGPEDAPALLAAVFRGDSYTDVLILRNAEQATGYRLPMFPESDIFNPHTVAYQYHSTPLWTLRAMLALPAPGKSGAPMLTEQPKYPECFIPEELPRPLLIRPLSPYPR
jgi:hypothetical protein